MVDSAIAMLLHLWETDPLFRIRFRTKPEEALQGYGVALTDEQRVELDLPPVEAAERQEAHHYDNAA